MELQKLLIVSGHYKLRIVGFTPVDTLATVSIRPNTKAVKKRL